MSKIRTWVLEKNESIMFPLLYALMNERINMKTWRSITRGLRNKFVIGSSGRAATASLLDEVQGEEGVLAEGVELGRKAALVGFDWEHPLDALAKVEEELEEVRVLLRDRADADPEELIAEVGDLLFAVVNVARKLDIDPARALGLTTAKFRRRFAFIEVEMARLGQQMEDASLEEFEALWQRAKEDERVP